MLEVPVYNTEGQQVDTVQVDEALFGGEVNISLLKQALTTYHANRRQGTVGTKSRGMIEGSTRKLFKQKGTGNARRGAVRSPVMKGGGVTFAKGPVRDFRKTFPKKMRQAAVDSALLAKMQDNSLMVVKGLKADAPKTKTMVSVLRNLKINRRCLLTLAAPDKNIYLSSRNISDLAVCPLAELNAWDILTRPKMLLTDDAMQAIMARKQEAAK
ncbi:MAG: 50S ribosomal protein L4 [Phycisphaerae bacterium]|nr:50S ribosomal protein L4 [Phycisphaerae bacterium]